MTQAAATTVVHDLVGVSFGPSSIALAITLQERVRAQGVPEVLFLGKQDDYRWHGDTLMSQSELQISFLRDLVSLRNPASPYSSVNYMHRHGHLVNFINLSTFYPYRMEFDGYLRWVTSRFQGRSRHGEEILHIGPVLNTDQVEALRVISRSTDGEGPVRTTRVLVISPDGTPRIPQMFRAPKGDDRVFHHSQYLEYMIKQPCSSGRPVKIAIIGGGQNAAEAFIDLNGSYPSVQTDVIPRAPALEPADDSPSVDEMFTPKFTDLIYNREHAGRERLLREYHNANYSVVDTDLIERIYDVFYRQKISGIPHRVLRCMTTVERTTATAQGTKLALCDAGGSGLGVETYNAVILATGYKRQLYRQLLGPLAEYLGDHEISRDYRLQTDERCEMAIYAQGFSQTSHDLSDTLLSVLPVHAEEVSGSLYQHLEPGAPTRVLHEHALAS